MLDNVDLREGNWMSIVSIGMRRRSVSPGRSDRAITCPTVVREIRGSDSILSSLTFITNATWHGCTSGWGAKNFFSSDNATCNPDKLA